MVLEGQVEERVETGFLFGFYGPLLTERQKLLLSLWCEEDLSLSEIAEREGISRQGVHDTVHSAQRRLYELESKLGLAARYRQLISGLETCLGEIRMIPGEPAREIEEKLLRILAWEEDDDGV
ncbi:MAG: DNA-binding protein [Clostridiales bacterium]|nr:DNA-binding protein [Clostridiales bacterium]